MDKLSLSNFMKSWLGLLVSIFLILLLSCENKKVMVNTEVFCPDGSRLLIKNVRAKDLEYAAQEAYKIKKKFGTSETNTVFRLIDGRTLSIARIPPEKMVACAFKESYYGFAEKSYIR